MDNEEIIKNLLAVCNALNNVEVKGRQNLINLSGSIEIIENVIKQLGVKNEHLQGGEH